MTSLIDIINICATTLGHGMDKKEGTILNCAWDLMQNTSVSKVYG